MKLEEDLRQAFQDEDAIFVALPDVDRLLRGIDRRARRATLRRAGGAAACAVAVLGGGFAFAASTSSSDEPAANLHVAHESSVPYESKVPAADEVTEEEIAAALRAIKPAPPEEPKAEEPKPAPKPEPKPAPKPAPKPEVVTKPAPPPVEKTPPPPVEKPVGDATPPPLKVLSPESGAVSHEKVTVFRGETEPGAAVYIDGQWLQVSDGGGWSVELELVPGKNVKRFKAMDEAGNRTYVEVIVYYEPPAE